MEIINPGRFPAQLSPENIKLPHESYPYNKLIAQVLYQTNYLEKWGTGAGRIVQIGREQNLPEPEWKAENGMVSIVFSRPEDGDTVNDTANDTVNDTVNVNAIQNEIIEAIKLNNHITYDEIADALKVSRKTVARHISSLKEKGVLVRIGGDRGGFWEIREE